MTLRWQAVDPLADVRAMVSAAFDQRAFRFRNDDGSETSATWKAAQNAAITQEAGVPFRLRIEVQETAGGSANNQTIVLQSNVNGTGWFDVGPASTMVQLKASPNVTNQTPTTNQLTAGTGAFIPGVVLTESSGTNISFSGNDHTEVEWAQIIIAEEAVTEGSTVQFRVTINGSVANTVTASPSLTVTVPIVPVNITADVTDETTVAAVVAAPAGPPPPNAPTLVYPPNEAVLSASDPITFEWVPDGDQTAVALRRESSTEMLVRSPFLISDADLQALSTSGTAWDNMVSHAEVARTAAMTQFWLPNFGSNPQPQTNCLAAALIWRRDPNYTNATAYRQRCEDALRHIIGTEDEASTDGTGSGDRALSVARQMGAWMFVADLINFDGSLTGTRTGWTDVSFNDWLLGNYPGGVHLLDKAIGDHSGGPRFQVIRQMFETPSSWGLHSGLNRGLMALWFRDQSEWDLVVAHAKGFFGDRSAYGDPWPYNTSALKPSFIHIELGETNWIPINNGGWAGGVGDPDRDGIFLEQMGRSNDLFPDPYPSDGVWTGSYSMTYNFAGMSSVMNHAVMLSRQGYDVWNWSNQAVRRVAEFLHRRGWWASSVPAVDRFSAYIIDAKYGTNIVSEAGITSAYAGRAIGYTDWLYG